MSRPSHGTRAEGALIRTTVLFTTRTLEGAVIVDVADERPKTLLAAARAELRKHDIFEAPQLALWN